MAVTDSPSEPSSALLASCLFQNHTKSCFDVSHVHLRHCDMFFLAKEEVLLKAL